MKRLLTLLLAAALLLAAGCTDTNSTTESAAPAQTSTVAETTAAAQETTTDAAPVLSTEAESTTAPTAAAPQPETETTAAATTEPLDPWSLMEEVTFEQGDYTDDCGNVYSYSYAIPGINADTEGAAQINAEIDRNWGAIVRDAKANMDKQLSLNVTSIGCYGQVWEDILTVVIVAHTEWDSDLYGVYCYETSTGRWLSTPDLLDRMGILQETFLETCSTQFRQFLTEQYGELDEEIKEQIDYTEMLEKQGSETYVNLSLMTYPDQTGDLVVIAPILSVAGAAFYYHPIYLGLGGVG